MVPPFQNRYICDPGLYESWVKKLLMDAYMSRNNNIDTFPVALRLTERSRRLFREFVEDGRRSRALSTSLKKVSEEGGSLPHYAQTWLSLSR